jgi:hypothetical protein
MSGVRGPSLGALPPKTPTQHFGAWQAREWGAAARWQETGRTLGPLDTLKCWSSGALAKRPRTPRSSAQTDRHSTQQAKAMGGREGGPDASGRTISGSQPRNELGFASQK